MARYIITHGRGRRKRLVFMAKTGPKFFPTKRAALRVSKRIAGRRFYNPRIARMRW